MTSTSDRTPDRRAMPFTMVLVALMALGTVLLGAAAPAMAQQESEAPPPEPVTTADPLVETDVLALHHLPMTADELAIEAEGWQDLLKARNQEISDSTIALRGLEGDPADAMRAHIAEISAERDQIGRNYMQTLAGWEKKGGDPDAVAGYRQYYTAVFTEELRVTDFQTLMDKALAWLTDPEGGLKVGYQVAVIIGSLAILLIVARIIRRFAGRAFGRLQNVTVLLQTFLIGMIYWLTLAFGLMVVLSFLGIDVTPLFALVGGAAFIIAFAMQDTLGNIASGLMIMINRPFDVGDFVDTAGINGTVDSVSVASTTFITPDNQRHVVPNSMVWGNIITNVTSRATRRVDLVFGIGYGDDIEKAQQVLEAVVAAHPLTLDDPAPTIRVSELADSSVNFICRPWSKTSDYWAVHWDLTRQVKEAFDKAGISIPFPQRDVHVHQVAAS